MNGLCPTCGFEIGDIPVLCTTHEWLKCVTNLKGRIAELEAENERLTECLVGIGDAFLSATASREDKP